MKVFDANFLSLLLVPNAPVPDNPQTGKPVERVQERIEELVRSLDQQSKKILIPTPALSEFLVLVGSDAPRYLAELNTSSVFRIVDFDQRAAVEAAARTLQAKKQGDKKGGSESQWSKIKFDRQIVAIAKVNGADAIYSTDRDVVRFGRQAKIDVINVHDLPDPPPQQIDMSYEELQESQPSEAAPDPHFQFDSDLSTFRRPSASLFIGARAR